MPKVLQKSLILLTLVFFFSGCAGPLPKESPPSPLRVGVFPYYPPMIFEKNGEIRGGEKDLAMQLAKTLSSDAQIIEYADIRGAEADLAIRLAKTLGREAQFIEFGWEQLIPTLMDGKIDIIMSGMSITGARKHGYLLPNPISKSD